VVGIVGLYLTARSVFQPPKRPDKRLDVAVLYNAPLFSQGVLTDRLSVSFGDSVVRSPHQLVVKIRNAGETAIRDRDVVEPLSIKLGDSARVMEVSIVSKWPVNLTANIEKGDSVFRVAWPLLNPTDSLVIGVVYGMSGTLAESSAAHVSAQARIEGLRDIDFHSQPPVAEDKAKPKGPIYTLMFFSALVGVSSSILLLNLRRRARSSESAIDELHRARMRHEAEEESIRRRISRV